MPENPEIRALPNGAATLLLTPREAAGVLRISERTLWTLTRDGEVPTVRIGRRVLYDPKDLQSFCAARKTVTIKKAAGPANGE